MPLSTPLLLRIGRAVTSQWGFARRRGTGSRRLLLIARLPRMSRCGVRRRRSTCRPIALCTLIVCLFSVLARRFAIQIGFLLVRRRCRSLDKTVAELRPWDLQEIASWVLVEKEQQGLS